MTSSSSPVTTPAPAPASVAGARPLRRLQVKHETAYHYQSAVALGYSLAWLTPRSLGDQRLLEQHLVVLPKPRFQHHMRDAFGNTQHYFEVHKSHSELRIQSTAIVERESAPDVAALTQPWESAKPKGLETGADDLPVWEFIYPTELVPLHAHYTDYACAIFTPGRPLGEALLAFNHQVHTDFQYVPGSTAVDTPLEQVWEHRSGVCQDFAHFALAALRGIGLAVAYVSGYLLTHPRPGEAKLVGADASHAWFAVWTPDNGWLHLDPTNDIVVGDEHIVLAIGRDYSDSPPVKGVCFSGGLHQLSVAVTVNELAVEPPTTAATEPVVASEILDDDTTDDIISAADTTANDDSSNGGSDTTDTSSITDTSNTDETTNTTDSANRDGIDGD